MQWTADKYLNTFFEGLQSRVIVGSQTEVCLENKFWAKGSIMCRWAICTMKMNKFKLQKEENLKSTILKFRDYIVHYTTQKDFKWIIQHLTSPTNNLKGCEINIPESVFFCKNGKPEFMLKKDKDGCLVAITQPSKLQIYKIRRALHNIIRARKRGEVWNEFAENQNQGLTKQEKLLFDFKESHVVKLGIEADKLNGPSKLSDQSLEMKNESKFPSDGGDLNKDSAIFRFRNGRTKIVGDAELAAELSQSTKNGFWENIASIHTLVKAKVGIGESLLSLTL